MACDKASEVPHLVKWNTLNEADNNAHDAKHRQQVNSSFDSSFKGLLSGYWNNQQEPSDKGGRLTDAHIEEQNGELD